MILATNSNDGKGWVSRLVSEKQGAYFEQIELELDVFGRDDKANGKYFGTQTFNYPAD